MANEKNINLKKEQVTELANKIKESNLVLLVDSSGVADSTVSLLVCIEFKKSSKGPENEAVEVATTGSATTL